MAAIRRKGQRNRQPGIDCQLCTQRKKSNLPSGTPDDFGAESATYQRERVKDGAKKRDYLKV